MGDRGADSASLTVRVSRLLLDPFTKFIKSIAMELESRDVGLMKFMLKGKLPEADLDEIVRIIDEKQDCPGLALVSCLSRNCQLAENNLDLLIELLRESYRLDLAKRVQKFKDENTTVKDSPDHQVSDRLPATPSQHLVFIIIHGQKQNLTASKINKMKKAIQTALDLAYDWMVTYIRSDQVQGYPGFFQTLFQLSLEDVRTLDTLRRHALTKKDWLLEMAVVQLKIDQESPITLEEEWRSTRQNRPAMKRLQSILGSGYTVHDNVKLDVIFVIETAFSSNLNPDQFSKMLKQCKKAIKRFSDYKDLVIQVAVITYVNHDKYPSGRDIQIVEIISGFSDNLNDLGNNIVAAWPTGGRDGVSGLADALKNAVHLITNPREGSNCLRREATKVCIATTYLQPGVDGISHHRCPHGHDAIELCNLLAEHAVPLYLIGIEMPSATGNHGSQDHSGRDDSFLAGLAAIGGGKFIPLGDVNNLAEVIQSVAKESISLERLMGTVADLVISEINRQYGDVNIQHLATWLQSALNKRTCHVNCLSLNGEPFKSISQLAQIISWADSMQDAKEAVIRWRQRHQGELSAVSTSSRNYSEHPNILQSATAGISVADVEMKDGTLGSQQDILCTVGFLEGQGVDLGSAFQMVRRQIQRSAYYRPT